MANPIVQGCILKYSRNPQFTFDALQVDRIGSPTIAVENKITFQSNPDDRAININYDYVEKNINFSAPLNINGRPTITKLSVTNDTAYSTLICKKMELNTINGTKDEPYNFDDNGGICNMIGNKLFFQYTASEWPGPPDELGVIVVTPLLDTCCIFIKDIKGINDIPVNYELTRIYEPTGVASLMFGGIPPDPDGICRGMLLLI